MLKKLQAQMIFCENVWPGGWSMVFTAWGNFVVPSSETVHGLRWIFANWLKTKGEEKYTNK